MSKKILIAEDEQYLVDMYTMKFESEGYQVVAANDGLEAVELAQKEKPDLILLDLVMPKMDGFQVLDKLRANPDTKDLIIYIFSNLGQGDEVEQGMNKGADGYFVKSNLTPSQLMKKVKKIFAGEDVEDEADEIGAVAKRKISKKVSSTKNTKEEALSILLIEDEAPILKMYQARLEKEGMFVQPSMNGAWGLNMAKKRKFDVIIMDMNMPAMNGYEAIKKIKESEKNGKTLIMIVSNSAQDADIEKAKKKGADVFLLKSRITPSRLVKEIKKRIA